MKTSLLLVVGLFCGALVACSDDSGASSAGGGGSGGAEGTTASTAAGGEAGGASDGGGTPGATTGSTTGSSTSTSASGGTSGTGGTGGGAPASDIDGYWVWTRQIENGVVTLEVTDADMEAKVGSTGWPGCPDGIICTRYGIHKVALSPEGQLHYQHNVTTSSDFQTLGTWADGSDGLAAFERQEQFSCAHPDAVNADVVAGGFRYRLEAGELWVSVAGFGGFAFTDPGAEPTTWLVYKPVTRDDYYGRYMIRICQPFDQFTCHEGCFDDSLVDEP